MPIMTKERLRKKKNAELSKLDRKLEKLESQMLSPNVKYASAKERRLLNAYKKIEAEQTFIQFIKYKAIEQRLKK